MRNVRKRLTSFQIIIIGFLATILLGTFLLMLPFSSSNGQWSSFGDALFTATSSVCVTGLVVQDTGTYWSGFGQVVILLLIQIGGMGVVTVALAIYKLLGRNINFEARSTMQEAVAAPNVGGIVRLLGFILKITLFFEALGALLLALPFCGEYGFLKGIWYAVFHSISAFCNAGFDLFGGFASLTRYQSHPLVNATIMLLIVAGGLGFLCWSDIVTHRHRFAKYRLQSKIVLITTAVLLVVPAVFFFWNDFAGFEPLPRVLSSVFQSTTARTAGFNTVNFYAMTEVGIALMIALMLVGGSPGSTAGGMKTTTLAVLLASQVSVFRRKKHTELLGRRLGDDVVRTAAAILTMYLVLFFAAGFAISILDGIPLLHALFESGSAIGTVGLTVGITNTLGSVSRVILMVLMFFGRVGGLTLIFAAVANEGSASMLPQEKVTVG